jgi:hypothetical protein
MNGWTVSSTLVARQRGSGIAALLSWPQDDVDVLARMSADVLIMFVAEPSPRGILNRPNAVTSRLRSESPTRTYGSSTSRRITS